MPLATQDAQTVYSWAKSNSKKTERLTKRGYAENESMHSANSSSEYYFREWSEYYRRRRWARASAVSFPALLTAFALASESLLAELEGFPPAVVIGFGLLAFAALAALFAIPLLKWITWKCPRCHQKYAYPLAQFGIWTPLPILWRLAFDSRCSTCRLECGAHEITFTS
jgi:hypothetical protein